MERGIERNCVQFCEKEDAEREKAYRRLRKNWIESEEYLAPFYRLVQENPELSVKELALKA